MRDLSIDTDAIGQCADLLSTAATTLDQGANQASLSEDALGPMCGFLTVELRNAIDALAESVADLAPAAADLGDVTRRIGQAHERTEHEFARRLQEAGQ